MKSSDLKKLKVEEKKILDYFVKFCEENNLTYYLAYGTLIGAVRHKGFIPWDDDIDVHMPADDYIKFLKLFKEKNKNDDYFLQTIETEKYYHATFAKIRKNHSCMVEKEWSYMKIHKGINIDIFPLYPYPDNKKDRKKFRFLLKLSTLLVSKNNKTNSVKNKIVFGILRIIPRKITNKWSSKIVYKLLNYKGVYSKYITEACEIGYDREWFDKSVKLEFEGAKYNAPSGYDQVLTSYYGDYMTPPKIEDRVGHGEIILSFDKNYDELI